LQSNPLKWTTPDKAGAYQVSLIVSDGKGGEDTKSMNVDVKLNTLDIITAEINLGIPANANLQQVLSEEGNINVDTINNSNTIVSHVADIVAGDWFDNTTSRGFISFDITGLAGATIQKATLTMYLYKIFGDVAHSTNLGAFKIFSIDYGARPIIKEDYDRLGNLIEIFSQSTNTVILCTSANLATELQKAVNAGRERFQLRTQFTGDTDLNNTSDYWLFRPDGITFSITYTK